MYRIGICDDAIGTCSQLEDDIQKYMKGHYIEYKIEIFYSGETLCRYLKNHEKFSLIFLDIELPQSNGIQVGRYLREILEDEITDIIYISSKTSYAMELFANRPLDFIIKPIQYENMEKILDVVMKRNGIREKYFEYQTDRVAKKIPLQQIMYFRSDNKKIHIVLKSGKEEIFSGKLLEAQKQIPEEFFMQIHKSYLVNYNYVSEYSYEWVKMLNGDTLNISKAHRKEVKLQLMKREMQ